MCGAVVRRASGRNLVKMFSRALQILLQLLRQIFAEDIDENIGGEVGNEPRPAADHQHDERDKEDGEQDKCSIYKT